MSQQSPGFSTRFLGLLTILHFNTAARFLKKPSCLSKPRYVVAICSPFTTTMRAFLSLLLVLNVAVFAKRFGGGEVGNRAVVEAVNGREVQVFGEDVTEELTGNWEAKGDGMMFEIAARQIYNSITWGSRLPLDWDGIWWDSFFWWLILNLFFTLLPTTGFT